MDDKYLPEVNERIFTVQEQISECKRLIYRNKLENLLFQANNEKARIKEVEYNNQLLAEKIDTLQKELDRLQK